MGSQDAPQTFPQPPADGWASRNEAISYHSDAVRRIAAVQISAIEAGQDIRARMLRARKRGPGEPLRVLFLLPHVALFDAYASVHAEMARDPAFAPEVLAFRRQDLAPDVDEEQTRAFLKERGIDAHVVGFDGADQWPDIDPDAYDILFYTAGTLAYPEPYRIARTGHHFLTCYIAYGVLLADQPEIQFDQDSQHCAWRVYASTQRDLFFYEHYRKRLRSNARLTGYPKFDLYGPWARDGGDPQPAASRQDRPMVVWAPHWTIGLIYPQLNMGLFDRICMGMIELMDAYPGIDFVYRPHPNLRHALAQTTFMSNENYAIYLDMLRARPNCRIELGGDNVELFAHSAAMITDSVSFLAEYLPTGRPLLFLDRPDRMRMNDQGEDIASLHFQGRDLGDIRTFIEDVVLGGADPRAKERRTAAQRLFSTGQTSAAAAIIDDLRTALLQPEGPPPRRDLDATRQELADRQAQRSAQAQALSNAYWTRQSAYNYALNFPERHRNQIAFIRQWLMPRLNDRARVLDIGCADGWSSCAVAQGCGELHGFDLNPAFIDLARSNAAAASLTNCRFEVGDALALPLEADSYDAAMLGGLLTCIVEDAKAASILAGVARATRIGGALLLKDTLHRGQGSRLNIQEGYGAVYRDLPTYEALVKGAGFRIGHGEWIEASGEHGSYMLLATRTPQE
jgi:ubiquinone/menaquinone biosynthesis C-methylase UbiE